MELIALHQEHGNAGKQPTPYVCLGGEKVFYQQPAVAGVLAPVCVMLYLPQLSLA